MEFPEFKILELQRIISETLENLCELKSKFYKKYFFVRSANFIVAKF